MYRDQSALASPIWSIQTPFPGVSGVRGRGGVGVADGRIAPGMNGVGGAGRGRAGGGSALAVMLSGRGGWRASIFMGRPAAALTAAQHAHQKDKLALRCVPVFL
jgi:hypothetical protein